MSDPEYVVDKKVTVKIFTKGCVFTNPRGTGSETLIGKRLENFQYEFEAGKGVRNMCWSCLYNGGICKSARTKYKETGEEFLIFPKINDVALT